MNQSLSVDGKGDILIVDDDVNNLQVLSEILSTRGYAVRGARNGMAALSFIENDIPDLVLLDVRMPGMDGFEVCRRLKADDCHSHLPVIFLSALQDTKDKVMGFEAGGVDFINKPFQAEEVLARVHTHITLGNLQKNLQNEVEKRTAALEKSREQTRLLAGRMLTIQENERKRLARELHDDLSQRLAILAMSASQARSKLLPVSTEASETFQTMQSQLVSISEDVHAISRQLHPSILEDLGLVDAVRNEINAFGRREKIEINYLSSGIPEKLPKDVSLCLFRIIQEGLRNIAKHALTDSASITLIGSADHLDMEIRDNGCGFNLKNKREQPGLGLISIGERVRMIDGKLEITSSPGQGTRIQVSAPIKN